MERIDLSGASIAIDDRGRGPAVIFAHGLGGNLLSWWQQLPILSRAHRCIAFSHRGFYGSTTGTGVFDVGTMAQDIEDLADSLGLARFALVAQSMSGRPAIELALRRPDRLTALVLCSTSGGVDPQATDAAAFDAWTHWARERLATLSDRHASASDVQLAERRPDLDYLYARLQGLTTQADIPDIRAMLRSTTPRPPSDLSRIGTPTLWLGGAKDPYFPTAILPALSAHSPRGGFHLFETCSHSPYFEDAEAFNVVVERFLADHAG